MSAHGAIIRAGVGFIYPSYKSLQAVMTDEKEDDLTWLRYWVVLSAVIKLSGSQQPRCLVQHNICSTMS